MPNEPDKSTKPSRPDDTALPGEGIESPRVARTTSGTSTGPVPRESARDALSRARGHAQAAVAESLAAIEALLDAASIASSGEAASTNRALTPALRLLENLRNQLVGTNRESIQLLQSIAKALDAEIARWEDRARNDPDARSVLRAFLGLRELLWEFGVRPSGGRGPARNAGPSSSPHSADRPSKKPNSGRRKRVQRITVEE